MSNKARGVNQKSRTLDIKKSNTLIRLLCVFCIMVLVLTCCIGCTSKVSTEEFDTLKKELTDEIKLLEDGNKAIRQELDSLKGSYAEAQEEIDSLKSDNEDAQKAINSLKSSNQALQDELDSTKSNYQSAQEEIDSLKSSNESAKQEINLLKGSITSTNQEIDALKSNNEALQQEIDRLKEQIKDLQDSITPGTPSEKIRIYIDQGHNPTSYHNAGATGNGLYEQDLTFTIGILLVELLEEDGRFEVCLSRPTADTVLGTDSDSSLDARVQGAKDFGADYFISLHTNSYVDGTANGIEVYAAEQDSTSYDFGSSLLQGMIDSTNLRNRGMKLNPDLRVLKNATMPAVLLEMGFISNSGDAALLSESPELFAQGIYDGILEYFNLQENSEDSSAGVES